MSGVAWLLPRGADEDAWRLVVARGLRGFADGMVSVLLASYLSDLGFSAGQIGLLVTATLLGSAALTLAVGVFGGGLTPRSVLLGSTVLMFITGLGFASISEFWPLLLVAFAGTLNPSSGDVSIFLPIEQAVLSSKARSEARTALFARYTLAGSLCAAVGALASGLPVALARAQGWDLLDAQRAGFVLYAIVAIALAVIYRGLPRQEPSLPSRPSAPLSRSRHVVLRLAALFSLDSFGGGFLVNSLLALWLFERFDLSLETAGAIFFAAGVLSALAAGLAMAGCQDRTDQDHGVHPPSGQPAVNGGRIHADGAAGGGVSACAHSAFTNGCAGAAVLRDGHGATGRARGCRERHQRTAQPRYGAIAGAGRLDAGSQ
jgi:MFS family permease